VLASRSGVRHGRLSRVEVALSVACASTGLLSVVALLAWVYGLGSFAAWFWGLSVPASAVLVAVGLWSTRTDRYPRLRVALFCGLVGGLVGTFFYDAVRLPQVLFGIRPFAPIESYGLLMLDARASSPATELAGWAYNLSNGIGFGISYAVVALGRRWPWAVAWAFVLETVAVASPFSTMYALAGKWDLIALAYLAHIAYGYPLGRIVEAGPRFAKAAGALVPHPGPALLGVTTIGLLAWHWPFAEAPVGAPATIRVSDGMFAPKWVRLPIGGCATATDGDAIGYTIREAIGAPTLSPGGTSELCFARPGMVRARTSDRPDAGGFVLVDPAIAR
jgi:hypothetical protein